MLHFLYQLEEEYLRYFSELLEELHDMAVLDVLGGVGPEVVRRVDLGGVETWI